MVFGHGSGSLGVPFFIIKCTAKGTDYSKTKVLQNLKDDALSGAQPDPAFYNRQWTYRVWQRSVIMKNDDGTYAPVEYKIPYLRSNTGVVITVQEKVSSLAACCARHAFPHAVRVAEGVDGHAPRLHVAGAVHRPACSWRAARHACLGQLWLSQDGRRHRVAG